ncbi:MAG: diguanylate cyclase [Actinobacteria bacterium]|nr:diguanylate cyclase [Actinomycetota bacterium]
MNEFKKTNLKNFIKKCNELKAKEKLLKKIFNNINSGIVIYEVKEDCNKFIIKDLNKAVEKIEKVKKKDVIGKNVTDVFPGIIEFGLLDIFKRVYKTGKPEIFPLSLYKDNRISGLKENYVFKLSSNEIVAIYNDLTEIIIKEEKLKESEEKYRSLFERSIDGIYQSTINGKYIDANPALVKMLGYKNKEELMKVDIPSQLYFAKNDRPEINERDKTFCTKLKKKNGTVIDVEISSRVVREDDKPLFYEGIVRDITERKKNEEQLKFLSYHDKLTGLYNRAYLEEELKRLDVERQLPLSIVMADINGLKLVNDTFGHKEGDLLLYNVAKIFKNAFRKEDIISRYGGDEFVILLPKTSETEIINILNRIEKERLKFSEQKIPISISIGSATKYNKERDIKDVINEAEELMYKKKLIESKSTSIVIINTLKDILFEKDFETAEHTERVKDLAIKLGKKINLSENFLTDLSLLSELHDIGKIAVPEEILLKKEKLSESEYKIVKRHSQSGYNIVRNIAHLSNIADAILYHHEWWNGSGYPHGLKGSEIPLISRIIAIVDAYDVMTNGRPYKNKMSKEEAFEELKKCSGTQFDPDLVNEFISMLEE